MNEKQKKKLVRIVAAFLLLAALMIIDGSSFGSMFDTFWVKFTVFLIPYLIIGYDIVLKAIRNISHGQVFDENFLMTIATFGAFGVREYSEAVAVMLFYQVGEFFQDYAVNKSRQSISDMMNICPEYANKESDGKVTQVDPDDVEVGDIIVIRPGERIPLDGEVIYGESLIDTSALTGESVPRSVKAGAEVISGCVNGSGLIKVLVTKEFEDSTVSKILELVENAGSKKAKVENFITKFARYYTPVVVVGAAILAFVPPIVLGGGFGEWIARACTFLVISCPCALVISVPLSFFGGIGAASKKGVLIKGSNYMEALSEIETIVFDKTGTLTKGEFKVSNIITTGAWTQDHLLEYAACAESASNHPIAKSVLAAYGKAVNGERIMEAEEISGHGVKALIDGKSILAGNEKLLKSRKIAYTPCNEIGTVVYIAVEQTYAGCIIIADQIKETSLEAIHKLKKAGVKNTIMLTGDKKEVGEAVAKQLGLDKVYTELLPGDKVAKVEELLSKSRKKASLAFVGDGINDAPVLMRADVGIAMGSMGSDAAIEAADVVLMDDNPAKIADAVRIARKTLIIVQQNIIFALSIKVLILLLGVLGIANMWAAVFADVGVTIIAILNAMRTLKD